MRVVAGGVASVLDIHLSFRAALRQLAGQETFVLLGIDIGDKSFLSLEVERHRSRLILIAAHFEHRRADGLALDGVVTSLSVHEVAVETHEDLLAGQIHVLVFHLRRAIQTCLRDGCVIGQRVVGGVFHGRVDTTLTATVDAVEGEGVVNGLVVLIDRQLQGVHRRRVTLHLGGSLLEVVNRCQQRLVGDDHGILPGQTVHRLSCGSSEAVAEGEWQAVGQFGNDDIRHLKIRAGEFRQRHCTQLFLCLRHRYRTER